MRRSKRLQEKAQRAPISLTVPSSASRKLAKNALNPKKTDQSNNGNSKKSALHVFPEELWIIIFRLLEDSMDRYHATHACPSLREILIPKITTWLFPASIPNIYSYLSKRDALKCRQVCKAWRNGINGMVENTLCPKAVDVQSSNLTDTIRRRFRSHFQARFSMKPNAHLVRNSWMQQLPAIKQHPSNPIIGRSVVFCEEKPSRGEEESPATFFQNALSVVKQVGGHLSHIEFIDEISYRSSNTWNEYYLILQECLTFVPNLKSLVITRASFKQGSFNESELLMKKPLPTLEHLNTLILLSDRIYFSFHNQLVIKYAHQLKHLKCKWNLCFDYAIESVKAPKLEEFSIFEVSHTSHSLLTLSNWVLSPHLKKLQVWLNECSDGNGPFADNNAYIGWEMSGFLQFLAKYPKLVFVDVYYRNDFAWKNCFSKCLIGAEHAHSVKILNIIEVPRIVYDFLEYLPNLEELYVKKMGNSFIGHRVDDPKAKIRLTEHLYLNTIRESNVWSILKKLQLLQFDRVKLVNRNEYFAREEQVICRNKCTRKEFEAFQQIK